MSLRWLVTVGVLMEVCYLSFYLMREELQLIQLFMGVQGLGFLLLGFLLYLLRSSQRLFAGGSQMLVVIMGFGLLFRLTLVPLAPVASDDIYRYIWDGKIAANGMNPYAKAPGDPGLAPFHTADLPSKINFQEMRTIYPPLAQTMFFLSSVLFGDSLSGLKFLLTMCEMATILLLVALLRHFAMLPETVVLYAWSPVPVMYFGLDGHIDALGIALMLLALVFLVKNRHVGGAVAVGLASLAKLVPVLIIPFLAVVKRDRPVPWLPVIPLGILLLGYGLYHEPTGGLFESLFAFAGSWEFNGSLFPLLEFIVGGAFARIACGLSLALLVGWLTIADRPFIDKVFIGFLGFVIAAPTVHPWYLAWLAALFVVRWSPAVFALLATSTLSNVVVYEFRSTGVWQDQPLIAVLEYAPFVLLLSWEIMRGGFSAASSRMMFAR